MVDVAVGVIVVDEALLGVIESQATAGAQGDLGQVHQCAGAMPVGLVESEFFTLADSFNEVGDHRLGVGELRQLLIQVRYVGFKALKQFAVGPLEECGFLVAVFAVENEHSAVGVFHADLAPRQHGVVVLFLAVALDLHRALVVFAHDVLDRVEVVLAHVAQAAAVVVPVTSEGTMHTMRVVRLEWGGAKPHVVVELLGHGLWCQVGPATPVVFPVETGDATDGNLEWATEDPALDEFPERLDLCAHAIKRRSEAKPSVQAEDAFVLVDCLDDFFALVDCAAQRLLTPDVLAGLGGGDGDQRVPMRRSGDVDNIDVLTLQHLAEILVGLNVRAARFLGCLEMVFIDITNRQKLGLWVDVFEVSPAHAAGSNNGLGDDLAGRNLAFADNITRDDADGCRRGHSATGKLPTGELICLFHMPAGETYTYWL